MKIQILDSFQDRNKWLITFERLRIEHDIFYDPEYLNLFLDENSKAILFIVEENNKYWINCFIKKKIFNYKSLDKKIFYDLESPYGYCGPLSNTDEEKYLKKFQDTYFNWCISSNVLVEFVRFHPLLNNHLFFKNLDKVISERINRYTVLTEFNNDINFFNPKVRNKIRKTTKLDLTVDDELNEINFNNFKINYLNFLKEINADEFYKFNDVFFKKLYLLIQKKGFQLTIKNKDNFLGSSIFIGNKNYLNYYLTVITNKKLFPGINNLILYHAYKIGKKKKYKFCNLGGSLTSKEDSLLEFKTSMSNKESKFYIGYKVYNKKLYNNIVEEYKNIYPKLYEKHKSKVLCYNFII
jgi:hypothetical protein